MKNQNRKIYLIAATINNQTVYKIGFTKRKVEERLKEIQTGNCSDLKIIHVYHPAAYPVSIESQLHKHFHQEKINGEWFNLSETQVANFKNLCQEKYELLHSLSENNTYLQEKNIRFK